MEYIVILSACNEKLLSLPWAGRRFVNTATNVSICVRSADIDVSTRGMVLAVTSLYNETYTKDAIRRMIQENTTERCQISVQKVIGKATIGAVF